MVFTGTYEHTIDAKNRLAIPRELRSQIQRAVGASDGDGIVLYVVPGGNTAAEMPTLRLYTEQAFENRANQLDESELDSKQLLDYEEILFSLVRQVEIDKQGRILLPKSLIQQVQLGTEVVLLGVKDHLAIRNRVDWQVHLKEKLMGNTGFLMNFRQAMQKTDS